MVWVRWRLIKHTAVCLWERTRQPNFNFLWTWILTVKWLSCLLLVPWHWIYWDVFHFHLLRDFGNKLSAFQLQWHEVCDYKWANEPYWVIQTLYYLKHVTLCQCHSLIHFYIICTIDWNYESAVFSVLWWIWGFLHDWSLIFLSRCLLLNDRWPYIFTLYLTIFIKLERHIISLVFCRGRLLQDLFCGEMLI